jgi:broad specificity phosphatase PhoE
MTDGIIASRWRLGCTPTSGILLIRHGPRSSPDIPSLSAMLTDGGIIECQKLGRFLSKNPPLALLSSPVKRCIETGKNIVLGAGWNLTTKPAKMLGDPGPFVIGKRDKEKVDTLVRYAQEHSDWSFLHRHIAGEEIPGMQNRDVGTSRLVDALYPTVAGYNLCISHDSIIAAIIAAFGLNPDPWPDPLEGVHIHI